MCTVWSISILGGYLLGAIPFGFIVPWVVKGVDIRKVGSGNPGATNVARAIGLGFGIVVLALDFGKGFAPAYLAPRAMALWGAGGGIAHCELLGIAAGLAAILGHMFPVYMKFRGGKGVATGAGAFTALAPLATLVAFLAWLAAVVATRYVSLGSIVAAVVLPVGYVLFDSEALGTRLAVTIFCAVAGVLVIVRHRSNIVRLLRGQESKFGKSAHGTNDLHYR